MNQKHLLRFMKKKVRLYADEVVTKGDEGEPMTLEQVFQEMNLTVYDLSIDSLGMHTDANTFARFDKFNLKYNPLGKSCACALRACALARARVTYNGGGDP